MNNNYSKTVAVRLSEMQHVKQITEFQSVYAYENNQRTNKIIGKKQNLLSYLVNLRVSFLLVSLVKKLILRL